MSSFYPLKKLNKLAYVHKPETLKKQIQTLINWATNQKGPRKLLIYKLQQYHVPRVISKLCKRLNVFVLKTKFFIMFILYENLEINKIPS